MLFQNNYIVQIYVSRFDSQIGHQEPSWFLFIERKKFPFFPDLHIQWVNRLRIGAIDFKAMIYNDIKS